MPRLLLILLLSLGIASSATAAPMAWTPIGNPGNAADAGGLGAIAYSYNIGTYEVTNAQYAEFLNAVARTSDPYGLWNARMANTAMTDVGRGGITRVGIAGGYTYSAIAGRENMPVNWVSFYDALRLANWMNNGMPTGPGGSGATETGAYSITAQGIADNSIVRNLDATVFVASEDEWYKAAYYDPSSASYFDYAAGSNAVIGCGPPVAAPNAANCLPHGGAPRTGDVTAAGSYAGSPSPYGTFDQGGNVWEWVDTRVEPWPDYPGRFMRGGAFNIFGENTNQATGNSPGTESAAIGFRVTMFVPEPSTGLLVIAGLLGLAGWRRTRD